MLAVIGVALAAGGGGDEGSPEERGAELVWVKTPLVFTPDNLPDDRTMTGQVRNDSLRKVRARAKPIAVVDADGKELDTVARFSNAYSHNLYPPLQRPKNYEESTQARLSGEYVDLEPRQVAPLTVSWRTRPGMKTPLKLEVGDDVLAIPAE